jgi:hypothetical protein
MTCLAVEPAVLPAPARWQMARAAVFWGFILLVIAAPAALGAVILARG